MNYISAYNYLLSLNNLPCKKYLSDKKQANIYLQRTKLLLNFFNNPENNIPHYIHVTGTSGKGSVCLFLNSILQSSGKKVGMITSPHPSTITERWEINGIEMPKKDFIKSIQLLKINLKKYEKLNNYDWPSFFEICTVIGLNYFAKQKIDFGIIEVGCGGRNDSTNIIPNKDIVIITNIGLDHVGIIGNNKKEIAEEKSGIIKKGCAVFTMEQDKKIVKIFEKECKKNKGLFFHISPINYKLLKMNLSGSSFVYKKNIYAIHSIGEHQIKNAILAIEVAKHLKIANKYIKKGLQKTLLPIRMEIISKKPLIILDGAHNADKIKTTVDTIIFLKKNKQINNINLICGFSANKDIEAMTKQLASLKPKIIVCSHSTCNKFRETAKPDTIKKLFKEILPQTKIKKILNPQKALSWTKKQTKKDDILIVTGSMFLSGELRNKLKQIDN